MRCPTLRDIARAFVCGLLVPAPAAAQIQVELVATGLTQPVAFVQNPADPTMQVIVQQDGRVRILRGGVLLDADFLDLRAEVTNEGEQGLLGLAFAPDYASSGRVFVNFINRDDHTVIARFNRSAADPLRLDPGSRFDLRWPDGQRIIQQPFGNHNGGNLVFGPDGFLYIGLGDGGSGNDPFHNAQNPQTLLGKMLRIDVSVPDADPEGYDVPPTNPFVGRPDVLDEIWSFGLRNPWRYSFDDPSRGGTGAMLIGDVGQNRREEINHEPAGRGGRNYGWRNREGAADNVTSEPPFFEPLVDPILDYPHSEGRTVTGGFVYRGVSLGSSMRGRYVFGDFIRGRVWSVQLTVDPLTGEATASNLIEHTAELGAAASSPSSFGVDAAGELYVVNYGGTVHRLFGPGIAPDPDPEPDPPVDPGAPSRRRRPPDAPVLGSAIRRPQPAQATVAALPGSTSTATSAGTGAPAPQRPAAPCLSGEGLLAAVIDRLGAEGTALVVADAGGGATIIWIDDGEGGGVLIEFLPSGSGCSPRKIRGASPPRPPLRPPPPSASARSRRSELRAKADAPSRPLDPHSAGVPNAPRALG